MGDEMGSGAPVGSAAAANGGTSTQQSTQDLLADIFGGDSLGGSAAAPAQAAPAQRATVDDIMGLFGGSSSSAPPLQAPKPSSGLGDLDLLGGSSAPAPAPTPAAPAPTPSAGPSGQAYTAYDANGLKITLTPQVSPQRADVVNILAKFTASREVADIKFQAAVPKSQKLQMLAISSANLSPGENATQQMRVMAPQGAQVRLRLRVGFQVDGQEVSEQVDFSSFPANLLA